MPGEEGDHIPIAIPSPKPVCFNRRALTVATRMTPALRWAAMRAISIINVSLLCEGQSHKTVTRDISIINVSLIVRDKVTKQCPQITTFWKREEDRSCIEPRSIRLLQPNALPLGQAGSTTYMVGPMRK